MAVCECQHNDLPQVGDIDLISMEKREPRSSLSRTYRFSVFLSRWKRKLMIFCLTLVLVAHFRGPVTTNGLKEQVTDFNNWLHYGSFNGTEIASLMTEWYELLREMHYLGSDAIRYPPRVGADALNLTRAYELGFDDRAVDLAQRMPYIVDRDMWAQLGPGQYRSDEELEELIRNDTSRWLGYMQEDHLWGEARFLDFADWDTVREMALYSVIWGDEGGEEDSDRLPDWAFPLTAIGNHGPTFVLDMKRNVIVVPETEMGDSSDPAFEHISAPLPPPGAPKYYYFLHLPARSAPVLLRGFINRLRTLEELPGGLDKSDAWYKSVRSLYETHGWPDRFDGVAFDIAYHDWDENQRWPEWEKWLEEYDSNLKSGGS